MLRPTAGRRTRVHRHAGRARRQYLVDGRKPLRWVRQTDFTNEEAVGFLGDRLAKLGVEAELAKLGAQAGAEVTIGDVTFDWEPTLADGDALGPARHRQPASCTSGPQEPRAAPCRVHRASHPLRGARAAADLECLVTRPLVADARRVVVKVGSSSLTTAAGGLDAARVDALVDVLAARDARRSSWSPAAPSRPASPRSGCRRRPRDLATLQACASVGQLLLAERYAASFARYSEAGRPGAADQRGRHPPRALPQRPPHAGAAARPRRRPGRQRERRRRHRRDPLQRQRPAGRARRPSRRRRPAGAAHRRRRRLRAQPAYPSRGAARSPRCTRRPTSAARPSAGIGQRGRRHRRDADEGRRRAAGGLRGLRGRHRCGARSWRRCSPARTAAPCFTPPASASRRGCSGWPTRRRPRGRLYLDAGAVDAWSSAGGRCWPPGSPASRASSPPATRSSCRPDGRASGAGWSATTPRNCPPCSAARPRELGPGYSREVVHRDDLVIFPS